jgi:DNA-binding PadR family transcriptional regulator
VTRVFGRNELKQAILEVLDEVGPANGYGLMQALEDRIGPTWRPSPGAIYPALLALEELGLVRGTDDGGGRIYELAEKGRLDAARYEGTLDRVAHRASTRPARATLGGLLDRFASDHPHRRGALDEDQVARVAGILERARTDIDAVITTTRGTT